MNKTPKHQGEIYSYNGYDDVSALLEADKRGFTFFTWGSKSQWYAIKDGRRDGTNKGYMSEVPQAPDPLLVRVMEYLAHPSRSDRGEVVNMLTNEGFFNSGATNEGRVVILHHILDTAGYCDGGKRKFKEFMGDTLPPKPKPEPKMADWQATFTVPERWNAVDVKVVLERAVSDMFKEWANGDDVKADWGVSDIKGVVPKK